MHLCSQYRGQDRLLPAQERELGRPHSGNFVGFGEARRRRRLHQHQVYDPHLRELHVLITSKAIIHTSYRTFDIIVSYYRLMSIYSGFATRAQEECYDQAIDSLLYVLQRRIIKFYKNEEADEEKFISLVLKIHHQLRSMENNKYLEPKTSQSILELVKFMSIHQKNIGA